MSSPMFRLQIIKQCLNSISTYLPSVNSTFKVKVNTSVTDLYYQYVPSHHFWNSPVLSKKRKTKEERKIPRQIIYSPKKKEGEPVDVWRNITVKELANVVGRDLESVLEALSYEEDENIYYKPSSYLYDWKVIRNTVNRLGFKCKLISAPTNSINVKEFLDCDVGRRTLKPHVQLLPRPPVVTVMGHVDHGKTSLLDALRNSHVVDTEFGGITQHIGAFTITLDCKAKVTFLDTPGHAAFKSMRNRGAQCTDIVVLVVAADDGVMDQTVESIKMANDAKVPIIVAINKIDKYNANIEKTKQMLASYNLHLEEIGGDIQAVPISAKQKTNLNLLIEAILVQAQIMDLRADYDGFVEGVIIESKIDLHRGKVATILVQHGTLKKESILTAGLAWGKVRNMFDDKRAQVVSATPSSAVEVMGWRVLPQAGDVVIEVETEKKAQEVVSYRNRKELEKKLEVDAAAIEVKREEHLKQYKLMVEEKRKLGRIKSLPLSLMPELPEKTKEELPNLNVIIRGDVTGSVEAILNVVGTYYDRRCSLNIVSENVGAVTISDVEKAEAFNAIIYAFNTSALSEAKIAAEAKGVTIKYYNVIYNVIDDMKEELSRRLPFAVGEEILGEAEVLKHFFVTEGKIKYPVAGCRCTKGILKKTASFKVIRNNEVIYTGTVHSMRHQKNEVTTIKETVECGLMFTDVDFEFLLGDKIICYTNYDIPQKINWDPGF